MVTSAECLVPGLAQWKADRRVEGFLLGSLFSIFLLAAFVGPHLVDDSESRYELMWNILAFSPTRGQLILSLGIGMALTTWLLSLLDHHCHVPPAYSSNPDDQALWETTQGLWLKGDASAALATLELEADRCRRDPMWHYLRARLCVDLKRSEDARRSLNACNRIDTAQILRPERERLEVQLQIQGDAT